jgi:hypothetical protein
VGNFFTYDGGEICFRAGNTDAPAASRVLAIHAAALVEGVNAISDSAPEAILAVGD